MRVITAQQVYLDICYAMATIQENYPRIAEEIKLLKKQLEYNYIPTTLFKFPVHFHVCSLNNYYEFTKSFTMIV